MRKPRSTRRWAAAPTEPRVRQALSYAFDFEWTNKNLFYGLYTRSNSYFANSELASAGLPSGRELEILEEYRGRIPDELFTTEFQTPITDGSGQLRTSSVADEPGSGNVAGIKDPVVDALVDRLIEAPSRAELVATTRALDRVLLWGHYTIPHWYSDNFRVVHWDKFGKPAFSAPYTGDYFVMPYTWWYDAEQAARLEQDR